MNDTAAVSGLTHLDAHGKACMVDVSGKAVTVRSATATAQVRMRPETLRLILTEGHKNGDVLAVARIAGIQAAKRCAEMIPLCHPLLLSSASIEFNPDVATSVLRVLATCRIAGPDGRGDGGDHGGIRGGAHDLRYVQGSRPGNGHREPPSFGENGRQKRGMATWR